MEVRVGMVLAHDVQQSDGDVDERLDLVLQLSPQGQIDFSPPDAGASGQVLRGTGRAKALSGRRLIRVETGLALAGPPDDEEPLWGFDAAIVRPGEYVTVRNPRGEEFVFRIVGVEPGDQ
jgi:hypothetical protein